MSLPGGNIYGTDDGIIVTLCIGSCIITAHLSKGETKIVEKCDTLLSFSVTRHHNHLYSESQAS